MSNELADLGSTSPRNGRRRRLGNRARYNWRRSQNTFFQRDLLFGRIVAFPGNPFQGTEYDWAWLLQSVGVERYRWSERHGISARRESPDFRQFLIPGV